MSSIPRTTPLRARMGLAIAASLALHAAMVLIPQPPRGAVPQPVFAFVARLGPAPAQARVSERRAPEANPPVPESVREIPAPRDASALPARRARAAGDASPRAAPSVQATGPAPNGSAARPPGGQADAGAGSLIATRYYLASELERRPLPQHPVQPAHPAGSASREGVVTLRIFINERGTVDEVSVVRAEPAGVFEQSATDAFARARFFPGTLAGAAVKSQMVVEVRYRLENGAASGRGY